MEWLRLYTEARTDRKLQSLPDDQFRVWFNLLCFMGEQPERGLITGYDRELLAVEVAAGDTELLNVTLERLIKLRIVTCDGDDVRLINFEKRQYDKPSDRPERVTERVRRHRAKQETPMKRDVTPGNALDTDTETDTETERGSTPPTPPAAPDTPAQDLEPPANPSKKPLPEHGPAQRLVKVWADLTGVEPANYGRAVKTASNLVKAGCDEPELRRRFAQISSDPWWVERGFSLGTVYDRLDQLRTAETVPKPRGSPANGTYHDDAMAYFQAEAGKGAPQ